MSVSLGITDIDESSALISSLVKKSSTGMVSCWIVTLFVSGSVVTVIFAPATMSSDFKLSFVKFSTSSDVKWIDLLSICSWTVFSVSVVVPDTSSTIVANVSGLIFDIHHHF